jgi:hypothetical protein
VVKIARVLIVSALVALGPVPPALAGGSLLQSANRLAQQAGRDAALAGAAARPVPGRFTAAAQGTLAESSMSKRKKFFIAAAAVIGVAVGIYLIDHGVEDNTPSSKGTRKD